MAPLFMYYVVTTLGIALAKRERASRSSDCTGSINNYYALHADMQKIQKNELLLMQKENLFVGLFIIL